MRMRPKICARLGEQGRRMGKGGSYRDRDLAEHGNTLADIGEGDVLRGRDDYGACSPAVRD